MNDQIESYNFFSSLFLNLPDKTFVENLLNLDFFTEEPGADLIKKYLQSVEGKSIDDIFVEISVDRTHLLHGLTQNGPRPPYESVYTNESQQDAMLNLNKMYASVGFSVSTEAHQPSDYLGIELAFMQELYKQGETTDELRKTFFNAHLKKWGHLFAAEMIKFAKTDFYRGIGHLLDAFLKEEAEQYA